MVWIDRVKIDGCHEASTVAGHVNCDSSFLGVLDLVGDETIGRRLMAYWRRKEVMADANVSWVF